MCKFNLGGGSIYGTTFYPADLFSIKLVDCHIINDKPKSDFQDTIPSSHES